MSRAGRLGAEPGRSSEVAAPATAEATLPHSTCKDTGYAAETADTSGSTSPVMHAAYRWVAVASASSGTQERPWGATIASGRGCPGLGRHSTWSTGMVGTTPLRAA